GCGEPVIQHFAHFLIDAHGLVADFDDARADRNKITCAKLAVETDVMFQRNIAKPGFRLRKRSMPHRHAQIERTVRTLGDVVLNVHMAHLVTFLHRDIAAISVDKAAHASSLTWLASIARSSSVKGTVLRASRSSITAMTSPVATASPVSASNM